MKTLFCSTTSPKEDPFKEWRDTICDRFSPAERTNLSDRPFTGKVEALDLSGIRVTRLTQDAVLTERVSDTIRKDKYVDDVSITIRITGQSALAQYDRDTLQGPGDISIINRGYPAILTGSDGCSADLFTVPRARMESEVGPVDTYAGLTLKADQPTAMLARRFIRSFIAISPSMDVEGLTRLSAIATDLTFAAVIERLGREQPRRLTGTLTVQRAKSHIRSNIEKQSLDPETVAAAVGVSTRRLQELFAQHGQTISGLIWNQRCDLAAKMLKNMQCDHLLVSEIAFLSGFKTEPHFSRRFKEKFDLSPRDFRAKAAKERPSQRKA